MPFDKAHAVPFALLAMYAEDMHRDVDAGPKLLAPDIDARVSLEWDVKAFLVANDAIFPAFNKMKIGAERLYYGYVGEKRTEPGTWIVALRGTAGIAEWIIDGQFLPEAHPGGAGIMVEHGFWGIYASMQMTAVDGTLINPDAAAGIAALVGAGSVTVTGHSLGSALASYLSFDLASRLGDRIGAYLFASPRTGNKDWVTVMHTAMHLAG